MKRRVQRAHSNRRALRIISATHKLSLGEYNVLVDASFLRATVMAFLHEEHRLLGERANRGESDPGGALMGGPPHLPHPHVDPFTYMTGLIEESFGVSPNGSSVEDGRRRTGEQGRGEHHQQVGARKAKGVQLHFCYLPETTFTLHRLIQRQQQAENNKRKYKTSKIQEAVKHILSRLQRVRFSPAGAAPSADSAKKAGAPEQQQPHRNEAKAIAAFLAFVAQPQTPRQQHRDEEGKAETEQPPPPPAQVSPNPFQERKNAHHFFVATQSHDVRRLLPPNAALLRLALHPNCVYVEVRDQAFHYPEDRAHSQRSPQAASSSSSSSSFSSPFKRCRSEGGPRATTPLLAHGQGVSAADVAFMEHLGLKKSVIPAVATPSAPAPDKRPARERRGAEGREQRMLSSVCNENLPRQRSERKRAARKQKTAAPNPLSRKKKQKREVFRI